MRRFKDLTVAPGLERLDGGSIVLVGRFNPAIFHPLWFAKQGLISDSEAETAEVQLLHPEVASFSLDWLGVQVIKERFTAATADAAHLEPLKDLVINTFSVLEHTPLTQMGMNREIHYRMPSPEAVLQYGSLLVPLPRWKQVMLEPRHQSVRMAGKRPGAEDAVLRVTVEPSIRLTPGIYFGFNEHYQLAENDPPMKLITTLAERWRSCQLAMKQMADELLLDRSQEDE